ncbi:flavin reductase family protein [Frankia sp. AgKG'84/4]|uniref:flavin reductase family protein n=1 Tax=Frankia sp. AgKG'84/4 TaxID=573490 RepID=UPI00200C7BFA|nr:flavin reductase family protein [Frankia sp. AgKG'84/4]MCL9795913.1 flavin reductase family protein [Frankia sp. AgKG'84/4]
MTPRPRPSQPAPGSANIDGELFRTVFRGHPAGVAIITADAGAGPVGFTATSLSSLSAEPPMVVFAISASASAWPHLRTAGTFVVNLLSSAQADVARRFARSGIDRFAAPTRWSTLATGEPLLEGGRAWLRCAARPPIEAGDHYLVVGLVLDAGTDPGAAPLIYHDREFHVLP